MRAVPLLLVAPLLALAQEIPPEHRTQTVERAVDEIARHLTRAGGKVAVCWLIDASPSMADSRAAVARRIDAIFADLPKNASMQMAVLGFDERPKKMTDLTDNGDEVRAAIGKVGTRGSGKENVFAAVDAAVRAVHGEGSTRAVIVVTDESGDDAKDLEGTIARAKGEGAQVYVVGKEARFGWTQTYGYDGRWWVPELAGPESAAQEVMHRNPLCCYQEAHPACIKRLVDNGAKIEEFQADDPLRCDLGPGYVVTAGFGPYALERLAKETGGRFTMMGARPTYDPKAMAGYEPELCTIETWKERNEKDPMRRSILAMFEERLKARAMGLEAVFNRGQAASLAARTEKAEQEVQRWIAMLEKGRKEAGEPTPGKDGVVSKRWFANWDLAVAQLHALAHYLEQYRLLLADLASGKREVGPHPLYLVAGGLREGKRRAAAIEVCTTVDRNHPGTPWAWTARWIASRLGGFDVVEKKPPTGNAPNPGPTPPEPPPPGQK